MAKKIIEKPIVSIRIALSLQNLAKMALTPEQKSRFFSVLEQAKVFSVFTLAKEDLTLLKSLNKVIETQDEASALELIQRGFPVTKSDIDLAMKNDCVRFLVAIVEKHREKPIYWMDEQYVQSIVTWAVQKKIRQPLAMAIIQHFNIRDRDSLLVEACRTAQAAVVWVLLQQQMVRPTLKAIEAAIEGGSEEVALMVLKEYPFTYEDLNLNEQGDSILHHAIKQRMAKVVANLLKLPNIAKCINLSNKSGYTALMLACEAGDDQVASMLIQNNADVTSCLPVIKMQRSMLPILQQIMEKTSLGAGRALKYACKANFGDGVRFLLEQGAVISEDVLILAGTLESRDLLLSLLEKTPQETINALFLSTSYAFAVFHALEAKNTVYACWVIDEWAKRVDQTVFFNESREFFLRAIKEDLREVVSHILSKIPQEQKQKYLDGQPLLPRMAESNQQVTCVEFLLEMGQDPATTEWFGSRTAVDIACEKGNSSILQKFLTSLSEEKKKECLSSDRQCWKVFGRIEESDIPGYTECAKLLFEHGGKFFSEREDLLLLVLRSKNTKMIDFLMQNLSDDERVQFSLSQQAEFRCEAKGYERFAHWLYQKNFLRSVQRPGMSILGFMQDRDEAFFDQYLKGLPQIKQDELVNSCNPGCERTPLGYACESGNFIIAQRLIERGADVTIGNKPRLPLYILFEHFNPKQPEQYYKLANLIIEKLCEKQLLGEYMQDQKMAFFILRMLVWVNNFKKMRELNLVSKLSLHTSDDFGFLYDRREPEVCDFQLHVGERTFYLNKSILASRTKLPFFQEGFCHDTLTLDESFPLAECDIDTLDKVFLAIYSNETPVISHQNYKQLAKIADILGYEPILQSLKAWLTEHPECEMYLLTSS